MFVVRICDVHRNGSWDSKFFRQGLVFSKFPQKMGSFPPKFNIKVGTKVSFCNFMRMPF